ncbi:hypothetical protein KIL84_000336, partial [Mauremys mutica]
AFAKWQPNPTTALLNVFSKYTFQFFPKSKCCSFTLISNNCPIAGPVQCALSEEANRGFLAQGAANQLNSKMLTHQQHAE